MSANCINQAYYRRNAVAICPSTTRFHVARFRDTYFLLSIICFGTSDRTRTCNLHFRRVLHFLLCYRGITGASAGTRTQNDAGLKPAAFANFATDANRGARGGTRTLRRPGSLVRRICQVSATRACWCLRSDLNREKDDPESSMSADCITKTCW